MNSKLGWEEGLPHSEPEFVIGNRFLGSLNVCQFRLCFLSLLNCLSHILLCICSWPVHEAITYLYYCSVSVADQSTKQSLTCTVLLCICSWPVHEAITYLYYCSVSVADQSTSYHLLVLYCSVSVADQSTKQFKQSLTVLFCICSWPIHEPITYLYCTVLSSTDGEQQ